MQHINDPLLQAYIDGFCNEERVNEVETHLDGCEECRARLESARDVAQRASRLLGALDPGPVHAPSFEELQGRAAARMEDGAADAVVIGKAAPVIPLWRRPPMAWAATLVIAFGLGWLARSPTDLAPELSSPAMSSADGLGSEASVAEQDAVDELGGRVSESPQVDDEIDDLQAATAKQTLPAGQISATEVPVAEPEPPMVSSELPATAAVQEEEAARRQVAQNQAAPAPSRAVGAVARGAVAGAPPAEAAPPPPGGAYEQGELREANFQLDARAATFADAGQAGGFLPVTLENADLWLGATPRQIPDLTLVRVEVAPGALAGNGMPGRVAVRLVYVADTGQEIALLQQYTGALEGQEIPSADQASAGRAAVGDTPARLERARADTEFRADSKVKAGADRDAAVGGLIDLPVTVLEADGKVTYRWLDDGGFVLAITGELEPDVLRGLARLVR